MLYRRCCTERGSYGKVLRMKNRNVNQNSWELKHVREKNVSFASRELFFKKRETVKSN
jgi:hypothetical protein